MDHEMRVLRLATGIFELLQKHHQLPGQYLPLLQNAALLHDIGRCRESGRHHVRGAKIIRRSRSLPLEESDRIFAAYAARYHRGRIPRGKEDARHLGNAPAQDSLRILLAIIRVADAMDKRSLHRPALALRLCGKTLGITIHPRTQARKVRRELWARRKFRMLREELGIKVQLRMGKEYLPVDAATQALWV